MDERVAAILCATAVLLFTIYMIFSPYQQCVREQQGKDADSAANCLERMGSR